jgi:hypothetical protein
MSAYEELHEYPYQLCCLAVQEENAALKVRVVVLEMENRRGEKAALAEVADHISAIKRSHDN